MGVPPLKEAYAQLFTITDEHGVDPGAILEGG